MHLNGMLSIHYSLQILQVNSSDDLANLDSVWKSRIKEAYSEYGQGKLDRSTLNSKLVRLNGARETLKTSSEEDLQEAFLALSMAKNESTTELTTQAWIDVESTQTETFTQAKDSQEVNADDSSSYQSLLNSRAGYSSCSVDIGADKQILYCDIISKFDNPNDFVDAALALDKTLTKLQSNINLFPDLLSIEIDIALMRSPRLDEISHVLNVTNSHPMGKRYISPNWINKQSFQVPGYTPYTVKHASNTKRPTKDIALIEVFNIGFDQWLLLVNAISLAPILFIPSSAIGFQSPVDRLFFLLFIFLYTTIFLGGAINIFNPGNLNAKDRLAPVLNLSFNVSCFIAFAFLNGTFFSNNINVILLVWILLSLNAWFWIMKSFSTRLASRKIFYEVISIESCLLFVVSTSTYFLTNP